MSDWEEHLQSLYDITARLHKSGALGDYDTSMLYSSLNSAAEILREVPSSPHEKEQA